MTNDQLRAGLAALQADLSLARSEEGSRRAMRRMEAIRLQHNPLSQRRASLSGAVAQGLLLVVFALWAVIGPAWRFVFDRPHAIEGGWFVAYLALALLVLGALLYWSGLGSLVLWGLS